jgi:hypothetical protein
MTPTQPGPTIPNVKLGRLGTVFGRVQAYLVDGTRIRTEIDTNFPNVSHHWRGSYIPDNEIWVDTNTDPGERDVLVMRGWVEMSAARMVAGNLGSFSEKGTEAEEGARKYVGKIRKQLVLTGHAPDLVKVYLVWGVREAIHVDFYAGGHGYVYDYVPQDEVWIDGTMQEPEFMPTLGHELFERQLMQLGMDYDTAHAAALEREQWERLDLYKTLPKIRTRVRDGVVYSD